MREEAERSGRSRSQVVQELADEAVRQRLFPEIGFRGAVGEGRIVVTHDVNTFPPPLREFAEREEYHSPEQSCSSASARASSI